MKNLPLLLMAAVISLFLDAGAFDLTDVIEWDVLNWSLALDFWEQRSALDLKNCIALELGAANGGLTLWLALKGARIVCSDLHGPTALARALHRKYNVEHLIEYRAINATSIPYTNHFDLVIFKSMLGDIGRGDRTDLQARAMEESFRALKPGGEIWFAENLRGSALHRLSRRFIKRGRLWRYLSIGETRRLLESFSGQQYLAAGFLGVFGRDGSFRNVLGAIDRLVCNRLFPDHWKYLVVARATKSNTAHICADEQHAGGDSVELSADALLQPAHDVR
ncbi:MAG TPA: class I SAM-dependent methyltransferase [Pyrinomonadaceae bacterium]|jgi:SAM-dependent methyltransferase